MKKSQFAFTLIELLVVISIIGLLMAISIFGLSGAKEASRDSKRKSDLELVRSGLELYKADCNRYPSSVDFSGSQKELQGTGTPTTCAIANVYISEIPTDPTSITRNYSYVTDTDGFTYSLCASLENPPSVIPDVTGCNCGEENCNYKVTNP